MPAITRETIGQYTPDDLVMAVQIFDALFPGSDD